MRRSGRQGHRTPADGKWRTVSRRTREHVAPYMAVGLSTVVHGIGSRRDIERNLRIAEDGIHAAVSIIGINMPVRLIALAEGALTGFTDEIFDIPHVTAARDLFSTFPGQRQTGLPRSPGSTTRTSWFSARRAGPR